MSSEAEAEHETSSERVKPEEHGEDTRPGSSHFRLPKLAGQLTGVWLCVCAPRCEPCQQHISGRLCRHIRGQTVLHQ